MTLLNQSHEVIHVVEEFSKQIIKIQKCYRQKHTENQCDANQSHNIIEEKISKQITKIYKRFSGNSSMTADKNIQKINET